MSDHIVGDTDSSGVSKPNAEELLGDNDQQEFIWADEIYLQKFVKALCTNYDLDQ